MTYTLAEHELDADYVNKSTNVPWVHEDWKCHSCAQDGVARNLDGCVAGTHNLLALNGWSSDEGNEGLLWAAG